ncbi:hypothetical protein C8Q76DRAFT_731935 [Earliella scabrosa]|nr:hypothetical protein C8Q76DRAFT_731935 [Earliella scabrosa]
MRQSKVTTILLSAIATMPWHSNATSTTDGLRITAIVGKKMRSTVECWTLEPKYKNPRGMDIQQLGDLTGTTYIEMPKDQDFTQGPYNAPNLQYFVILEGNATITFPTSGEILDVQPNRLYIAADTATTSELGHFTAVRAGSRILQFPFQDGVIPDHTATAGECSATRTTTGRINSEL